MKGFPFHILINKENICNYEQEQKDLLKEIFSGQRIVIYGRRNTGKTSLVQSVVIPEYRKRFKDSLIICADFFGCRDMEQISNQIRSAFQVGFSESFPKKSMLNNMFGMIKSLRPNISVDSATGEMALTLGSVSQSNYKQSIDAIVHEIGRVHKKVKALIVFDEFQDIALVTQAEGVIRASLQKLPADLPVVILGSKKHLLRKMFSNPKAPFSNWGTPFELPIIKSNDYQKYINARFNNHGLHINMEAVDYLKERVQGIPEPINIICQTLLDTEAKGEITVEDMNVAIKKTLVRFKSNFIEFLATRTKAEIILLTAIAKNQPVLMPRSREFLENLKISSATIGKIIRRFEDDSIIYHTEEGFVLGDPLLALYLETYS